MNTVASRDLRNHTADVLQRVADGEVLAITVHGKVVAELAPPASSRDRAIPKAQLASILASLRPDPGLAELLDEFSELTTDAV